RDDAQRRARLRPRGARKLARDQAELDLAGLEARHVLRAALGVLRRAAQRRLLRVHHLGEGGAEYRKAAARRGGGEDEALLRGSGGHEKQEPEKSGKANHPAILTP